MRQLIGTFLSALIVISLVVINSAEAAKKKKKKATAVNTGTGVVNVTGGLNLSRVYGGGDKATLVNCLSHPGINHAAVRLAVKGKSLHRVDTSEALDIRFSSAAFPPGRLNFNIGNSVEFTSENFRASNVNGDSCYGTFSQSGKRLSGEVICNNMVGEVTTGGVYGPPVKINIQASFECTVFKM